MPTAHRYRDRRAAFVENNHLRVTVLEEGGHIAEILDKRSGINPLWTPPWPSIEPAAYSRDAHAEYGSGADAILLAGIMGHNLCADLFGGPSDEEAAAGLPPHGEASVVPYQLLVSGATMSMRAELPLAGLRVERWIELRGADIRIAETIDNLTACDRPIAWTEHVTLGPPFLEPGLTEFRASATRSMVFEPPFGADEYLRAGATFDWPWAPRLDEGAADLRRLTGAAASSAYTAHLMDPARDDAFFVAFSPRARLAIGYIWKRRDFPWLGIWEENHSRQQVPWNGATLARGMEFGVSPFPEPRRAMIDRGQLFETPTYRWIPAKSRAAVEYSAIIRHADSIDVIIGPT